MSSRLRTFLDIGSVSLVPCVYWFNQYCCLICRLVCYLSQFPNHLLKCTNRDLQIVSSYRLHGRLLCGPTCGQPSAKGSGLTPGNANAMNKVVRTRSSRRSERKGTVEYALVTWIKTWTQKKPRKLKIPDSVQHKHPNGTAHVKNVFLPET